MNFKVIESLKGRDSFFGGRVNATKLYYLTKGSEKIYYVDFTSLYPWVNYTCEYPIGHPIISKECKDLSKIFGFVKCKVLPPQNLYHPVLPAKLTVEKTSKLCFPLCYTCAKTNKAICNHNDDQRCLIGTWTTPELNKALQKGYTIMEIYETHHWETKSKELFKDYVGNFLKIKQENSALPDWIKTPEDKQKYIDLYQENQGITLNLKNLIGENPGMRAVAKLCLNSLWGKFGQRGNKKQTKFISKVDDFYKHITNDKIDDFDFNIINDDIIEINYNFKDEVAEDPTGTNIAIASFTTSYARLKLYSVMEELGEQVLYTDTDSIIYVYDENNKDHKKAITGDYLGELTDELKGKYITEFISTGPKSYGYKLSDNTSTCKIKGFSLNWEASQKLNFDTMRDIIFNRNKTIQITNDTMIKRQNKELLTVKGSKTFSFQYNKRRILEAEEFKVDTLPYGFVC